MPANQKIMGVIGGLGPQASLRLYQLVIEKSITMHYARNNNDFPHMLLSNLPVPDMIGGDENKQQMLDMLMAEIRRLIAANCDKIFIACNTVHLFEDLFRVEAQGNFISLIDLVIDKVKSRKAQKVAVIGTPTTIQSRLYQDRLEKSGILIVNPNDEKATTYEGFIRNYIAGETTAEDIGNLETACQSFIDNGAEAVILGCTELPAILKGSNILFSCIDPLDVLANEICVQTLK